MALVKGHAELNSPLEQHSAGWYLDERLLGAPRIERIKLVWTHQSIKIWDPSGGSAIFGNSSVGLSTLQRELVAIGTEPMMTFL